MSDRIRRKVDPDLPLADRLVDAAISQWFGVELDIAEAASEKDLRPGIQHAKSALSGYWYQVTPQILDELRRAGLLVDPAGER